MRYHSIGLIVLLLMPLVTLAAPDGGLLYRAHCASCHGIDGAGGVGVPISSPDFLASVDNSYLKKSIRIGRPGRIMPAFTSLSSSQVAAIVDYIRTWEPMGLVSSLSPEPVEGDIVRGKVLYGEFCMECHGDRGEGGEGTGVSFSRPRDFEIMPTALNNSGFLASASDQVIRATLVRGREGTAMDPYTDSDMTPQQLDDIVAYVRTFEEDIKVQKPLPVDIEASLVVESPYSLEVTIDNVKRAAIGKNFRIIREQKFEQGLAADGDENPKEVIIYFCNFQMIDDALKMDPRVGLFMPCRITVVESSEGVKLMSINPKYLARIYNNTLIEESCQQMYEIYTEIMEEATF